MTLDPEGRTMAASQFGRRTFLRGAVATTGGVLVSGAVESMLGSHAAAAPGPGPLVPVADLRDGVVRLHLPAKFQYRSFHDTERPVLIDNGATVLPGRHDGMGSFPAADGNVWLVRNHEINGPGTAFGVGTPYDGATKGGTTTVLATATGEVLDAFTSLNGTQNNCSGGTMPWGSWLTCEETINGPDVGPDFTGNSNVPLQQRHGFVFEVPAGGQGYREPITAAGRFAHEAAAFSPYDGKLYMTEDNFGYPSGFYRYTPATDPITSGRLDNGGTLEMLRVVGQPNAHLEGAQVTGMTYAVDWVPIADPNPTFPYTPGVAATTPNDVALNYVGDQGRAQGAAGFSRLEGTVHTHGSIYFTSTQGGGAPEVGPDTATGYGNGSGQVWSYSPKRGTLTCRFQSSGPDVLDLPDNITSRNNAGGVVICEDGKNDNYIRGLTKEGELVNIALNRLLSLTGAPRFNEEFAGATFGPGTNTLYVNIQASQGISFAIWGPWGSVGV